ncbi:MAG: c-type cytochrome [Kofleriaceae bacterium]
MSLLVATSVFVGDVRAGDLPIGRSRTYDRYCTACHGELGDGRGPAAPFTWGVPRDFTAGQFKWSTTGGAPSDAELRAAIEFGAPGTSMPAFGASLTAAELDDLVATVEAFDHGAFGALGVRRARDVGPVRPANPDRGAYLWTHAACATCHGDTGHGDGPAAAAMPSERRPYDLTASPLHRPRPRDDLDGRRRAAAQSIAFGLAGTAMPAYLGQLSDVDLWALADHVVALGAHARDDRSRLDPARIAADRAAPLATAIWPGTGGDAAIWGTHLAPQGTPPAKLAPAEASLSVRQCQRCHAKQVREWTGSVHARAGSPGLYAQLDAGLADTCRRCHAPLAEQAPGAIYQAELRDQGVTCAACHLRGWTRNGPPRVDATLLAAPAYPREERPIYERADFCMPCHQLPPRNALAGKPLLDTYQEWLEGPYMKRGIQCQHCHMPNREHTWRGVHDPDTVRQGIRLDIAARKTATGATVVADLVNIGAGHDLPTTPTPALWLRIELRDARGEPIAGARAELRIGRDIWFEPGGAAADPHGVGGGTWHERSDTRIPPGAKVTLAKAWTGGRVNEATTARVRVEVWPDDYYEHFYDARLAQRLPAAIRAQYLAASRAAKNSHYVAEQRDVALSSVP